MSRTSVGRAAVVLMAVTCALASQVGLIYPSDPFGLVVRALFLLSDAIALALFFAGLDRSRRWTMLGRITAVRLLPTIGTVYYLRSVTGDVGDGLFLVGYVPGSMLLQIISGCSLAAFLRMDASRPSPAPRAEPVA